MWGLAMIQMFRAYQDPSFLNDAVSVWRDATSWVISEEDAANGFSQIKGTVFRSACNGRKFSIETLDLILHNIIPYRFSSWWCIRCDTHTHLSQC